MTRLNPTQVGEWEQRAEEARGLLHAPDGWPRAEQPLRVVILGWACLSLQAREGSGYNLCVSELAAGLAAAGHHVTYLRSGIDYSVKPGMWIKAREFWRGVGCFDFVNSPNLATANCNFKNVRGQMSSPGQTAIVVEWLKAVHAELVHVHSLEGFGFDLIGAIRTAGIPVVVTPHNYYWLCPQVDLLHHERQVCEDYDGGKKCVGCIPSPEHAAEVRSRRIRQTGRHIVGDGTAWKFGQVMGQLTRHLKTLTNGHGIPIVDEGPKTNGAKLPPPVIVPSPIDQNERLLAGRKHLVVLNDYGQRRAAAVAALNEADAVLAPSKFLMQVHEAMGVHMEKLHHVPLGQPHFDALMAAARSSPFYGAKPWMADLATHPLRLAYFGSTRYNKGLETLSRAIRELPADVRERSHFVMRAAGDVSEFKKMLHGQPVSWLGGYEVNELPETLAEFDVGILPTVGLENSPFVLLEHLHGGKFVIASRLGGPTDWIVEGKNGLMFAAGDVGALAAAISRVVRGEVAVPSQREVHEASVLRSYEGHVREVMGVYGDVCAAALA
jgi:glycosyltransferase involved in cell wall biosynthesis